jgi:hypothetical protein
MAYDERLAERLRAIFATVPGAGEKKMFGGVCFLADGKMVCGTATADLMVRVGPDAYAAALKRPHTRPMDFTGRPLVGFVYVAPAGIKTAAALRGWVERALAYVATVPEKKKPRAAPRPRSRTRRAGR